MTIGNSKKSKPRIIKVEYDTLDSTIAHCFLIFKIRKDIRLLSVVTFNLLSSELLCYKEFTRKDTVNYISKEKCSNLLYRPLYVTDFTQPVNGIRFIQKYKYCIITCPADSIFSISYWLHRIDTCFICPPYNYLQIDLKFRHWGFYSFDLSPNSKYLSCDFVGDINNIYLGGQRNLLQIYEYDLENRTLNKIIEDGTYSSYSSNSDLIIYRKKIQTLGVLNYKDLGYYIYDRNAKTSSFFSACDDACFVRPPSDYLPCGYY